MQEKDLSDNLKKNLKSICQAFDAEDRPTRERQLRSYRRLKLLWEGISRIYYSEVAHDWRIWDDAYSQEGQDYDSSYYDKPINVIRAYLESIIAALSVTVPPIKCYPDDADNTLDIDTAKAGDKITALLYRHNNAPMLWLHALYLLCTEGCMGMYQYPKEDEKYGTYEENQYEQETQEQYVCPNCNEQVPDAVMSRREANEFMPDDEDMMVQDLLKNENEILCPNCLTALDPELQKSPLIVEKLVGTTTKAKARICQEVYGGMFIKIPNYAVKQEDMPYLEFLYETHYTNVIARYPDLRDKFTQNHKIGTASGGNFDPYERWARTNPQYRGELPTHTITVRNFWLRPSSYHVIQDKNELKEIKKTFPNGCKVIMANDVICEAFNEDLDDCWTLVKNPLSDYLTFDPLGNLLISVQEITNEITSLTLQTIEHGIPQTFADPEVLDFNAYKQSEVLVGGIYPAKPRGGKTTKDAFFEAKTASLSAEVLPFGDKIQQLGQLVVGAMPSIFGGELEGSRTASEYSMSRAQSMQRLQTTWKMLTAWWKDVNAKAIPLFIRELKEDEHFVEKDEQGSFFNVFIKRAELEGKIGRIELEANENLPISWAQQKDIVMNLLQQSNPLILEALSSPENIKWVSQAIGLDMFEMPGEQDRMKQYDEIKILMNGQPVPGGVTQDPNGQPQEYELPSVEVDPDVDNHVIEAETCRYFLISEAGRLLKMENPLGYKNILLHMKMHLQFIQMQQMAAAANPDTSGEPNPEGQPDKKKPKGNPSKEIANAE